MRRYVNDCPEVKMDFISRLLLEATLPNIQKKDIALLSAVSESALKDKYKAFYEKAKELAEAGEIPDDESPFKTDKDQRIGKFQPWSSYTKGKQAHDNDLAAKMWWLWRRIPIIEDFNSANGTNITHGDIAYSIAKHDNSESKDVVMAALELARQEHPEAFHGDFNMMPKLSVKRLVQNWFSMPLDKKLANFNFAVAESKRVARGNPTLPQTIFAQNKRSGKGALALQRIRDGKDIGLSQASSIEFYNNLKKLSDGQIGDISVSSTSMMKAKLADANAEAETHADRRSKRTQAMLRNIVPEEERDSLVADFAKEIGADVSRVNKQWEFLKSYLDEPGVNDIKDIVWAISAIENVKKDDPKRARLMRDMLRKVIRDKKTVPPETMAAFRRMGPMGVLRGKPTGKPNITGLARLLADLIERDWRDAPDIQETEDGDVVSNKLFPHYLKSIQEWGTVIEFYINQMSEAIYSNIMDRLSTEFDKLDPKGELIYVTDGPRNEKAKKMRRQAIENAVDDALVDFDMGEMSKEYKQYIYDDLQQAIFEHMISDSEESALSDKSRNIVNDSIIKAINSGFKEKADGKGSMSGQMSKIVSDAINELTPYMLDVLYAALQDVRGKDSPLHKLLADATAKRRNKMAKKDEPKVESTLFNTPGGRFLRGKGD